MSVAPADFKQALGRFLSGITVVATEVDGVVHGMTASAFLSVSLDPPLVLVSVAKKAKMHEHLARASHWSATILAGDQAALSNHFAGYGEAEVRWETEAGQAPVLAGGLAWVRCEAFAAHDSGDHTLYVGRVVACGYEEREPLSYFRGKYRTLAP